VAVDISVLKDVEANLATLDIDEIKKHLEHLIKGTRIESPVFDPGAFLYRARRVTPTFNRQTRIKRGDLIYPATHLVTLGRLNRREEPMLYCSLHKECVFFELQELQERDELILTFWKTKAQMFVNNIGYTEHVFQQLNAKRTPPQWRPLWERSAFVQSAVFLASRVAR